jgi:hypothetical protein
MQIDRVPSMLQSVAQLRNWVVENVPCTDSMLAYDLFIKLGNDVVAGQPLDLATLAQGLPYPQERVAEHVGRMAQAGLFEIEAGADGHGAATLRATSAFLTLLDRYGRKLESVFIVREDLRSQQLLVSTSDPALGQFASLLYDRLYDMGWLYLHNFGSACFLMASLVRRLAEAHGHVARIASCYVEIAHDQGRYMLGAEGFAKPGQIDGHAVCIVDDAAILDFGLGNVRKGYRRDFHWGVACDYRRHDNVLGAMTVGTGERVTWKDDWQSPGSDAELARYAPHIEDLFGQYVARFR